LSKWPGPCAANQDRQKNSLLARRSAALDSVPRTAAALPQKSAVSVSKQMRDQVRDVHNSTSSLSAIVSALGCKPIAFLPAYVLLPKGTVNAALFLSQAVYWHSVNENTKPDYDGWFFNTRETWAAETMLTVDEIDAARKVLRDCGVIKECLKRTPARLHYQINFERLAELIESSFRKNRKLVSDKTGNRIAKKQETSLRPIRNLYKEAESTAESTAESENIGHDASHRAADHPAAEPTIIPAKDYKQLTSWLISHVSQLDDSLQRHWIDHTGELLQQNIQRLKAAWRNTDHDSEGVTHTQYIVELFGQSWDAERYYPTSFFDAVKKLDAGISLQEGAAA
jgi:hypothetical protein